MGIRSDVAIAVKKETFAALSVRSQLFVREYFEEVGKDDEVILFHCNDIKWYTGSCPEIIRLYEELYEFDDESYLIVEACHDYPESTDGDLGGWYDNPWEVFRNVCVSIDWCVDGHNYRLRREQ